MINNVQVLTFHVGPTVLTEITIDTLIRNFLLNKSYESLKDIVTIVDNGDDLFTEYVGKFYDRGAMTLWFDNAKHYTLPNHQLSYETPKRISNNQQRRNDTKPTIDQNCPLCSFNVIFERIFILH